MLFFSNCDFFSFLLNIIIDIKTDNKMTEFQTEWQKQGLQAKKIQRNLVKMLLFNFKTVSLRVFSIFVECKL